MQGLYSRLLVLFLCGIIIIDDINTLRVRVPSLRFSSTFSKPAGSIKKKPHLNNNRIEIPVKVIPLEIPSTGRNDEF